MFRPLIRICSADALSVSALTVAPSSAQTDSASAGPVMTKGQLGHVPEVFFPAE
jgi:hypothetical protein